MGEAGQIIQPMFYFKTFVLLACFEMSTTTYCWPNSLFSFQGNELMRILNIAAFAVSGYASTEGRQCKPFNPLLGETYEADYPDKGLRFFSEKASQSSQHCPLLLQELYRKIMHGM